MELRFVPPDLRRLDLLVSDVLAIPLAADERPPRGTAGLIDYRLAGRVSEAIETGALRGEVGEKVFLSGRPKLPFDRIFLYGQGDLDRFNPHIYAGLIDQILETLDNLGVRRAVVELPGRARDRIEPEAATEILLERAATHPLFDSWTLIESPAAQRTMTSLLRRDRRNDWRL